MCDLDHVPYLTFGGGDIKVIACEDVPQGFYAIRNGARYTHIGRLADGCSPVMVAPLPGP